MTKVSVITCARKAGDSHQLELSLLDNHIEHELIEVAGAKSIADGYNEGIQRATTDVFVFTHTDVTLLAGPMLWARFLKCVNANGIGFVGLAGCEKLPSNGVWWECPHKAGAVQHVSGGLTYMSSFGPYGTVQVMDGVFLACKRSVIESVGLWSSVLGWHFYDIEMTLRASLDGLTNEVVCLPIQHESIGEVGGDWKASRKLFLECYSGRF